MRNSVNIDIRGNEHEILQAVVFAEDRHDSFARYDFEPEDTERGSVRL